MVAKLEYIKGLNLRYAQILNKDMILMFSVH